MNATKKELDAASKLSDRLMQVANVLSFLLRPFSRLGFLRRLAATTVGGRGGAISYHAKRGEHEKAAALAVDALKEYRHQAGGTAITRGADYWWLFMHFAARSLEECDDREKREEAIAMARNGLPPFRGHYVAHSFLAFSRWRYRDGNYDEAIEFAEIAVSADDTWAEPDCVLGWYYLVLGGGDPLRYLTRAVRKDPGMLFRISNDPECRKHPHIVQKLKDLSADAIVTVRDEPGVDNGSASDPS